MIRLLFWTLTSVFCFVSCDVFAVTISADNIEYFKSEDKYVATGNVRIEKNGTVVTSEKAVFYQGKAEAELAGHVIYEDEGALINTEKADINLDNKTGKLYNAVIQLKDRKSADKQKIKYTFSGSNIQKISESHYYAKTASFTTCETEGVSNPDWCFQGKNVDVIVGKRLIANDVTYRINGVPVIYSPFAWAPVLTERQSGLLFPFIGNSTQKGFQFSPSYFWAIDENKDATIDLDYYSKRGLGKGVEYRYLDSNNNGKWYGYHLRDVELNKTFYELKGVHEHHTGDIKAYADINYLNESDFYKEFARHQEVRIQRFLQSTAEVSAPLTNSRAYVLAQHWKDLKSQNNRTPQRMPELGYVVNPSNLGPFMFNMSSSAANFYRDIDTKGQRLDIYPTLSYNTGTTLPLLQSLSLRDTLYNLQDKRSFQSSPNRGAVEYKAHTMARFFKRYESFTHVVEPSLEYSYISGTKSVPLFDSTELFTKTSSAQLSLFSGLSYQKLNISARLTQPYDLNPMGDAHSLSPTRFEGVLNGPFTLRLDMLQDFAKGRTNNVNSEVGAEVYSKTNITVGERYNRADNIKLYKAGIESVLSRKWSVKADGWYDFKVNELRDSTIKVIYSQKCWALDAAYSRKPGYASRPPEYSFMIFFELRGLSGERRFL